MNEQITIIPADNAVLIGGDGVSVPSMEAIELPESIFAAQLHAIQWHNGAGHVEFVDDAVPNKELFGAGDYVVWVVPFVRLWETEKTRIETEHANAEAEALALYNSPDARAERVRDERDRRITACDWIMARHAEELAQDVDTSLSIDEYQNWLNYRQTLRDLPSQDGFPWDGGDEETPWPSEPEDD